MNYNEFTIFSAIHLRNGEVVRFTRGDTSNPIVFHTDPIACAQQWIDQGAQWLQLINLDAAFDNEVKQEAETYEKLKKLEIALTDREPYKQTARLFQLILRKK